ncbi:hypothetical protein [Hyphomicrobium sp. CS1BSMeth3]|uniref:hypothetical protein n=1 Tax=Hyphomicrobium sp. CS1BSMeth3 TaxID=1892844 RepID=UPI001160BEFC|nr:hypothetical protein [Hyphomicrobium sp. CS1BSMeth3]
MLDELLMIGDVAEVAFGGDDINLDGQLLLCLTPYAFVRRPGGYVALLGGSAHDSVTLPSELALRVARNGAAREIAPLPDEDLALKLAEFGLIEIDADAWQRLPAKEAAQAHIEALRASMPPVSLPRNMEAIRVIGPGRFYSDRWCEPSSDLDGLFVARRPQAFGAPVWSAVLLNRGGVTSLLDLHAPGSRWRPCDLAWQLQAALDAVSGSPQTFATTAGPSGSTILKLFAPIPSWAERRLRLSARRMPMPGCLMAFVVPEHLIVAEYKFLQDYLWMRECAAGEGVA